MTTTNKKAVNSTGKKASSKADQEKQERYKALVNYVFNRFMPK